MTPDFHITAQGNDITAPIANALLSLSLVDEIGLKSDMLELTLDDRGHRLELPEPGAALAIALGYKETGLLPMGLYTVDELMVKYPPATLTIRAKAANLGGSVKAQKTRHWDEMSLSDIVATIAGEHGLSPKIAQTLAGIYYEYLAQTGESDLHFLLRLAEKHDAIATIKGEHLLFIPRAQGLTASGLPLPVRIIQQTGLIDWHMTHSTREEFKSVEASYHDQTTGKKESVTIGEGSPVKKLRHNYADKAQATRAAQGKFKAIVRGNITISITMPGDPSLAAETPINVVGFRQGVDGAYTITTARHDISERGYTTRIEAEKTSQQA